MRMKMSLTRFRILTVFLAIVFCKCNAAGGVCNHHCVRDETCNLEQVHDKCYYLFKDTERTWNESKHHCKSQNLSVGQIQKGFDASGLFLGVVHKSLAWQGGTVKDLDQLEYVTGRPFNTTKQYYRSRKCAVIKEPQNGKDNSEFDFEDEYCTVNHKYICRHGQYNLTTSQKEQTWFDARSDCLAQGGDLFYLNSDETLTDGDPLTEQLNETLSSDGSEIRNYSWGPGQPGSSQDCIALTSNNTWSDHHCTSKSSVFALCEKENVCINLPPPTNGKVYTESEHIIKGNTLIGHKAIFTCDEGFILKGSATLTCIGDGPENKFDGQQPTCERMKVCEIQEESKETMPLSFTGTPWILFAFSLLTIIIVGLVIYIIVISKRHRHTHDRMERHDNTGTSSRAMTDVTATGTTGNTDRSQTMRSDTGNNAADDTENADNENRKSSTVARAPKRKAEVYGKPVEGEPPVKKAPLASKEHNEKRNSTPATTAPKRKVGRHGKPAEGEPPAKRSTLNDGNEPQTCISEPVPQGGAPGLLPAPKIRSCLSRKSNNSHVVPLEERKVEVQNPPTRRVYPTVNGYVEDGQVAGPSGGTSHPPLPVPPYHEAGQPTRPLKKFTFKRTAATTMSEERVKRKKAE